MQTTITDAPPRLNSSQAKVLIDVQQAHEKAQREARVAKAARDAAMERYAEYLPINEPVRCGKHIFTRTLGEPSVSFSLKAYRERYALTKRMEAFTSPKQGSRSLKIDKA